MAALPAEATRTLFVRPREIYAHPELGAILGRTVDAAGERALVEFAQRNGYDVRALDRAAAAWTPHGAVYVGAGSFDSVRVGSLLWDRLLAPRQQGHDDRGNLREEGVLGSSTVSLLLAPGCGMAAFGEGEDTRAVDRILSTAPSEGDPPELLAWRARQIPDELGSVADTALLGQVRSLDLRVAAETAGLSVRLTLEGPIQPDAPDRIRRAIAALAEAPLGELSGAGEWLAPERVSIQSAPQAVRVELVAPWRALRALSDALRGTVGPATVR